MTHRVFLTRPIPDSGLALLRAQKKLTVDVSKQERPIARKELLKRVKGASVLLSFLTDRIDGEVMDAAGPNLKLIANFAVGFDNIDLVAAAKRGIFVSNTPHEAINESVAEHAIALMFGLAHRLVEADAFTRRGHYHAWDPKLLIGTDLAKKTVGIIGTGRIGSTVAERLYKGFETKILYSDIARNKTFEENTHASFKTLEDVLKKSDIISLHVPLTQKTKHLINKKTLALMKPTAFLINTARGPVVDQTALVQALREKRLAGAALDVFECEPLIACSTKDVRDLRRMNNVILTPHTGSATLEARDAMAKTAVKNILAILRGHVPPNAVGR